MQPVIVRTLRREFRFCRQAADSPLRFVEARPSIAGEPPGLAVLELEELHGFVITRLPGGARIEGTLRNLARAFDLFALSCGVADEGDAVSLPAALLKSPAGLRVAFVGTRRSGKTTLALGLMSEGWAFEGDERLFVRADGVVAHPRTIRLTRSVVRRQPQFASLVDGAPFLDLIDGDVAFALDPQRLGCDWRIGAGPLDAIVFLDGAMTGLCSIRRMSREEAFGAALSLSTMVRTVSARGIGRLRSMLHGAAHFHLQLGTPGATLAALSRLPTLGTPA